MANTTTTKHGIQRVDGFVGNLRVNMEGCPTGLIGTATEFS